MTDLCDMKYFSYEKSSFCWYLILQPERKDTNPKRARTATTIVIVFVSTSTEVTDVVYGSKRKFVNSDLQSIVHTFSKSVYLFHTKHYSASYAKYCMECH